MFDKVKQLMEMQKKMEVVKRELDSALFEISSSDGTVKLSMSGSQEVKGVTLNADLAKMDKAALENSLRDTYNRAIRHSHEIAAQKMKLAAGFDIPGLK
ncbi:MAG: YbaB/EbfC family nucleoid-associated protein [Candidatus Omnitrophota bacterium]